MGQQAKNEYWKVIYWHQEYGGMRTDQAHHLKELERENARLKKLVADWSLDNSMPQEVLSSK